jgi:hypothetical protein
MPLCFGVQQTVCSCCQLYICFSQQDPFFPPRNYLADLLMPAAVVLYPAAGTVTGMAVATHMMTR